MVKTILGLFLVLAVGLLAVPAVAAQSSFAWTLDCNKATAIASWTWLQNGVSIGSGSAAGCPMSGSGGVPSGANGIAASLTVTTLCGSNTASATTSFVQSKGVSIKLTATVDSCDSAIPTPRGFRFVEVPGGSADFSLST